MTASYVTETHPLLGAAATATFDDTGAYRYALTRRCAEGPRVVFVMLNPSTADALAEDPTIRQCVGFTRSNGCGALTVVNLYALRAADPDQLVRHRAPVGELTDHFIDTHTDTAALVVAAWGAHPAAGSRADVVTARLAGRGIRLWCLGTTRAGRPRHPLYVPGDTEFRPYEPDEAVPGQGRAEPCR